MGLPGGLPADNATAWVQLSLPLASSLLSLTRFVKEFFLLELLCGLLQALIANDRFCSDLYHIQMENNAVNICLSFVQL